MNRAMVIGAVLLGAGLIALGALLPRLGGPARPNVLLVVIDTLRADRIDAVRNGVPVMPYLSALAKECVRYEHAVSPCSWTRPAMASLFTSRFVDAHQVLFSGRDASSESDILADGWVTLPEYLQQHGYDTAGFQSNGNLAPEIGFGQGFKAGRYQFSIEARADDVTKGLLPELEALKPPFFMYAHYQDPHVPYDPPELAREAFGPLPEPEPGDQETFASDENFMKFYMDRCRYFMGLIPEPELPMLSEAGQERVRALYDGEARFADSEAGKLIGRVRRQYPDTLIIVVADHGEEFWERGGMGHGTSLYEEQSHVPLLIHGPGLGARTVTPTVNTVGLLPTIAAYLGLPADPNWQGEDLLAPGAGAGGMTHARTYASFQEDGVNKAAIWAGNFKLIFDDTAATEEMFDLETDPGEQHDLAGADPERLAVMRKKLRSTLERDAAHYRAHGADAVSVPIDPATLEALKRLGYGGAR